MRCRMALMAAMIFACTGVQTALAVTAVDIGETQVALRRHAAARVSFAEVERLLATAPVVSLPVLVGASLVLEMSPVLVSATSPVVGVPVLAVPVGSRSVVALVLPVSLVSPRSVQADSRSAAAARRLNGSSPRARRACE